MAEFDKLIVGFFVDEVVGGFFISVPPGHIACVYDRGRGILNKTWGPGLHLKLPFWQVAKLFNAQVIEYTIRTGTDLANPEVLGDDALHASTADGIEIDIEGSILFKLDKSNVGELWENVGEHFVSKIVRPSARSRIRSVVADVTYEQLINYRTQVEGKIRDELASIFEPKGLIVEAVLLSDISRTSPIQTDSNPTPTTQKPQPPNLSQTQPQVATQIHPPSHQPTSI